MAVRPEGPKSIVARVSRWALIGLGGLFLVGVILRCGVTLPGSPHNEWPEEVILAGLSAVTVSAALGVSPWKPRGWPTVTAWTILNALLWLTCSAVLLFFVLGFSMTLRNPQAFPIVVAPLALGVQVSASRGYTQPALAGGVGWALLALTAAGMGIDITRTGHLGNVPPRLALFLVSSGLACVALSRRRITPLVLHGHLLIALASLCGIIFTIAPRRLPEPHAVFFAMCVLLGVVVVHAAHAEQTT